MRSPATRIRFEETYPALYILFGACFFVGTDFDLPDAEVLADFRTSVSAADLAQTRAEMSRLLAAESTDWEEAAHQAWRYFATPTEIRDWLVLINEALLT
jgi:hypothetical protein